MPLWTDILEPAELTGFARASLQAHEDKNGSLERYLTNQHVDDTHVEVVEGEHGLQEAAEFRAFDAEPSIARQSQGKGHKLELPALGQKLPVSEYRALRLRNASDEAYRKHILKTTNQIVRAVADRMEILRGVVVDTGKATVNQRNFYFSDDFGRPAEHNITASQLFSAGTSISRLDQLLAAAQLYAETNNGTQPGSMLMSTRVYNSIRIGDEFVSVTTGRPMGRSEINAILVDEGLPTIDIYDRRIKNYEGVTSRVTKDDTINFLPAPGAGGESELGHTYWGTTLTATELDWAIEDAERAGIVAGVVKTDNVPVIAEVVTDAIGMPILGNAALSLALKVL